MILYEEKALSLYQGESFFWLPADAAAAKVADVH